MTTPVGHCVRRRHVHRASPAGRGACARGGRCRAPPSSTSTSRNCAPRPRNASGCAEVASVSSTTTASPGPTRARAVSQDRLLEAVRDRDSSGSHAIPRVVRWRATSRAERRPAVRVGVRRHGLRRARLERSARMPSAGPVAAASPDRSRPPRKSNGARRARRRWSAGDSATSALRAKMRRTTRRPGAAMAGVGVVTRPAASRSRRTWRTVPWPTCAVTSLRPARMSYAAATDLRESREPTATSRRRRQLRPRGEPSRLDQRARTWSASSPRQWHVARAVGAEREIEHGRHPRGVQLASEDPMRRPTEPTPGKPTSLERAAILVRCTSTPRRSHARGGRGPDTLRRRRAGDRRPRGTTWRGADVRFTSWWPSGDAAREARARAGSEHLLAGVGDERQLALEHEDELCPGGDASGVARTRAPGASVRRGSRRTSCSPSASPSMRFARPAVTLRISSVG